ncbi:uncharacterized protein RHOBADRAFT_48138 [Rhodotorula graminis WP1]|uniref:Carboxylic ester hydrolase n=1 Tax=Rhodotorula graminis (strain WP1) TaxID=578459 RepID=A0A194SCK6_RHOGW|nr:uncharacterized protein RHOBADRAFT_48138 [Rhodotorula graminis WP1]KPV77126.1 hypothetical protein RHOBADRAFT_48138 [Rhodotorula graminis WP1]
MVVVRAGLAVLLSFSSLASTAPTSGPSVTSSQGTFLGSALLGVESYKGIPFAEPPVGDLRFAPPVATTANLGVRDATQYGFSCPQSNLASSVFPGPIANAVAQSTLDAITSLPILSAVAGTTAAEDCLTLNVFRPAGVSSSAKLPVMVWFYGGAFVFGATSMYDAGGLVQRSVSIGKPTIFVTVNYRLNSFGFLPGKEAGADPTVSINAGLLDQRLALEWVQGNVAAFGGDSQKVTIFGESAGAISVAFQLLAYGGDITSKTSGQPLFRAAIMESGSPIPVGPAENGQWVFDQLTSASGCSSASDKVACLRALPYEKMVAATNTLPSIVSYRSASLPFLPRTDGDFVPDLPQELTRSGRYAKVPIINGDQADEGTILALGTLNITTSAQLFGWLKTNWFPRASDAQIQGLMNEYPADPTQGSPFDTGLLNVLTPQNKRINAIVGDLVFQAPRRAFIEYTRSTQNTWSYLSRQLRATPFLGTFHASDVLSVFGYNGLPPSREMQTRWITFASNLDPNVPGFPTWPQYGQNAQMLQFTDLVSSVISDTFRRSGIAYIWAQAAAFTL